MLVVFFSFYNLFYIYLLMSHIMHLISNYFCYIVTFYFWYICYFSLHVLIIPFMLLLLSNLTQAVPSILQYLCQCCVSVTSLRTSTLSYESEGKIHSAVRFAKVSLCFICRVFSHKENLSKDRLFTLECLCQYNITTYQGPS